MTMPPQLPPHSPFPVQNNHGNATAALVLGILGLTMVPGLGIIAWILGAKALAEIDENPQMWSNRDHANIGKILGIVGTVIFVGIILFVVCYFAVVAAVIAGAGTS